MAKKQKGSTGFRNGDLFCFNCGSSYTIQCIVAESDYVFKAIMEYSDKHKCWIDSHSDRWTNITHWMPLPEPPKNR